MQAQVPSNPYVALWARLRDFDPAELSGLIAGRGAVRAQLLRSTIHLVTARDALALHGLTAPVLARTFAGQAQFLRAMVAAGVGLEEVVAAGRELLAEAPRTRAELAAALGPRWPQVAPATLAQAVTFNCALVQVPPRGLWRESGAARWALTEAWLGAAPDPEPSIGAAVLRYLAAFGPATAADVRTWSGFTGLRPVIERLRPRLRSFRDEQGRELLDVADARAPRPRDAGAAALPPRVRQPRARPRRSRPALQRPRPGPAVPDRHVDRIALRRRLLPGVVEAHRAGRCRHAGDRPLHAVRARSRRHAGRDRRRGGAPAAVPRAGGDRSAGGLHGTTIGLTLAGSSRPTFSAASASSSP